jgi:hypothetical protein
VLSGESIVFVRNKFRNVQFVPHVKWSNISFNKIGRFFGKAFTLSLRVFKRKTPPNTFRVPTDFTGTSIVISLSSNN